MTDNSVAVVGFAPEEMDPTQPTRAARLKWVIVVNDGLPAGRAVNAAVCVAAATSSAVTGLLGDAAIDADGSAHPGLPWAGCSVLAADTATLRAIRGKAAAAVGCFVADMPSAAQHTRVYADYLAAMKEAVAEGLEYYAVSIVGPRNRVDKIVGRLPLMP
ncbi:DUF2000 domain-containing protein [Nonomuraea turkmeniaca]|uniref:DUF2000 domain-containing protein n=1 Tax=Nonomuraea turkmeniaca TaxID=103838 RepID=A0A5S4F1R3_9ACTN|nr:DUF2000 domain-containing protein [Nonomuraea turkmeniaca]TMR09875.1 DUF2000 domain-containing protein [Nonomuraea turkmeniaca]